MKVVETFSALIYAIKSYFENFSENKVFSSLFKLKLLFCNSQVALQIMKAFYGTKNEFIDVTSIVSEKFIFENIITIEKEINFNALFTDPKHHHPKFLFIVQDGKYLKIPEYRNEKIEANILTLKNELKKEIDHCWLLLNDENNSKIDITDTFKSFVSVDPYLPSEKFELGVDMNNLILVQHADESFSFRNLFGEKKISIFGGRKIYIYVHIAAINNWFDVWHRIFEKIENSGLYDIINEIRIGFLGNEENFKLLDQYIEGKTKIRVCQSENLKEYEKFTLEKLWVDAQSEDFYVLYLHTKGVSRYNQNNYRNIENWAIYLEHFLIERYVEIFNLFFEKDVDVVGCDFRDLAYPWYPRSQKRYYFEGNLWWSKSEHIKYLPSKIGNRYVDPELWIGSNPGVYCEIYKSFPNPGMHYCNFFENYFGKALRTNVFKIGLTCEKL